MATFWRHKCDTCEYTFETSGIHEFYVDARGAMADYGHPLPSSREAREAGIFGFYGRMWCLNRDQNIDVVVREFEHPVERDAEIWRPGALPEKVVDVTCPACGDHSPLMGDLPFGKSMACPKCGGTIRCEIVGLS